MVRKKIIQSFLSIVALALLPFASFGQFKSVELGVDGLTCSACSRSVEMSIRKLDFVQDVQMNLEHTMGTITFKPNAKVNVKEIAKAVVNAGFSVRYFKADFSFNTVNVSDGYCFAFEGNKYQFIKTGTKTLNGEVNLTFIGKEFLSRKEYKKWNTELKPVCDKATGTIFYVTSEL